MKLRHKVPRHSVGPMRSICASLSIAAVSLAGRTYAQDTPATQNALGGLEEVVVTAQRREESLQRAAIPVSAVSGDALISAGVGDLGALSKVVPSLTVQPAGGSTMNFYLRGVGTLQGNSFGENPIAFNFDGVYIARPTSPAGAFFDLERVEVVKGPQGTLYGRNATGGAINVLPKRPVLGEFGGDLTLEYGNYDAIKSQAALNAPLGESWALRLAGQTVDRDAYMSDGYDDEEARAARLSLLFAPSERFSAVLVSDYFHQGGKGTGAVLMPGSAFPSFFSGYAAPSPDERIGGSDPRSIAALGAYAATQFAPPFCGGFGQFVASGCVAPPRGDGYSDSDIYGAALTIEADLGFGSLTVVPAYRTSDVEFVSYVPGFHAQTIEDNEQSSIEVRLASNGEGRLGYVLGAYYFSEDQQAENFFDQGTASTARFQPHLETESQAVFGQATFGLTDAFRVVAGARYTEESREQSTPLASGGLPGPVFPPLGPPNRGSLDFSKTTWKGGVEWDAADDVLIYANVSTGFKAGGFFIAAPPTNTYLPEELTAYTLGAKNRFLDNRMQLNVEAFYWDYQDQQISFVGGITTPTGIVPGLVTVNAGQATIKGAELDLQFSTGDGLLSANVQYLDGEYDELLYTTLSSSGAPLRTGCAVTGSRLANPGTPSPGRLFDLSCAGRQTINSPEWTANLGYEHTFQLSSALDFVVGARTRVEESRYVNIDYLPEERQDSYTMSDAFITLAESGERWEVTAFVNNIEDETVISGAFSRPVLQTAYATLRPPRTYGIRGTLRF